MPLFNNNGAVPSGWLAFELSILRRLKFRSASLAFVSEPELGVYLKRWGVRVETCNLSEWAAIKATARIENNTEVLTEEDLELILEDAYVPRYKLQNPALRKWFNETDAWWLDNVRANLEQLETPIKRALALALGFAVGDYVLGFDDETRVLRQPLSQVYQRLWKAQAAPVNNLQSNVSAKLEARTFIAEQHTNLLFMRLPRARVRFHERRTATSAWREEWARGDDGFWAETERQLSGRLGSYIETRQQYLRLLEDFLKTASHLPAWALAHVEDGFLQTPELVETISRVRKVETIYTKDFSELMGVRATIITALG